MNTKLLEYEQSIAKENFIFPHNDSSVRNAETVEVYFENKTVGEHESVSRTSGGLRSLKCRNLDLSKLASKKTIRKDLRSLVLRYG